MQSFPSNIFVDACACYPPQDNEKLAMDKLFKLMYEEKVSLVAPYAAQNELDNAPRIVDYKRKPFVYTINMGVQNPKEYKDKIEVRRLLFGDKGVLKRNEINDIANLCEAIREGVRYFVTTDKKHILSKASRIGEKYKVLVVLPSEMLSEVKEYFRLYCS